MKKLINTALVYLIAGAAAGVFFREFTNFAQFTGQTTLGLMHPHLLVLGFAVFLIATLFALQDDFTGDKLFKPFYIVYNVGLVVTVCMMLVRGVVEVTGAPLAMPDAAISGIAGIGRIVGESAALLFTAGFGLELNNFLTSMQASSATLTVALYVYANERGETGVAFAIAAVLMILVLVINFSATFAGRKLKRKAG